MKTIFYSLALFVVLFLLTENLPAQNVYGPEQPNYVREILKIGSEPLQTDLVPLNQFSIIGKSLVNNQQAEQRVVVQWNIPDNVIPDNSTITSVELYFTYSKYNHNFEMNAQFSSISLDISNPSQNNLDQMWNEMSTSSIGTYNGVNDIIDFISNDPNDPFNTAVRDGLLNDRFVLGIIAYVPPSVSERIWHIQNSTITLSIEYIPPSQNVTVDQKLLNNTSVDSVGLWNITQSKFDKFAVPKTFSWNVGDSETLQGAQKLLSDQKYKHWEVNSQEDNNVVNHKTFQIYPNTNNLNSQFNPTQNVIKIQNSLEATSVDGGSVEFADPWLIDYPDPDFPKPGGGYYKRNRGMKETGLDALIFKPQDSPFYPDYTTNYNGDVYKGVFLNQSGPPLWNPPYYSVGMPAEQTINVNGQNTKFYPYKWEGTGVSFQDANANQTGVVFTSSNAIVTANYKGNLASNQTDALTGSSQRKIIRDGNGIYHAVYTSMDKLWYTKSLTTDFNGDWSQDIMISDTDNGNEFARSPSMDLYGNILAIVFEE